MTGTPDARPLVSTRSRVLLVPLLLLLHNPGTLVVRSRFSVRFAQNDAITYLPVTSPPAADTRVGTQSVACIM